MKSINTNILPKVSSSPPQIYWSLPYHYKFSSHQRIVQTGHSHDACTPPWKGKSCLSDNIGLGLQWLPDIYICTI